MMKFDSHFCIIGDVCLGFRIENIVCNAKRDIDFFEMLSFYTFSSSLKTLVLPPPLIALRKKIISTRFF